MSESLLIADISSWLRENALGNANAKPRKRLLAYLRNQGHSLPSGDPDRYMRRLCEKDKDLAGKIGACSRGYFWIVTADDRRIAQAQLDHPAKAMLVREKRIREAGDAGQMGLFEDGA